MPLEFRALSGMVWAANPQENGPDPGSFSEGSHLWMQFQRRFLAISHEISSQIDIDLGRIFVGIGRHCGVILVTCAPNVWIALSLGSRSSHP